MNLRGSHAFEGALNTIHRAMLPLSYAHLLEGPENASFGEDLAEKRLYVSGAFAVL